MAEGAASERAPWAAVEFFAGMGGMRCAGSESGVLLRVLAAYEISEVCQKAYCHNFGSCDWRLRTIERVPAEELDALGAEVWVMSPPCQPFTRSGLRQDEGDNRTAGLLHLVDVLPRLHRPPRRLLLENVIGFERSRCRQRLLAALAGMGWEAAEFALDPEEFGVPNRRPRYYGLFRAAGAEPQPGSGACPSASSCQWRPAADVVEEACLQGASWERQPARPLGDFLQSPQQVAAEEATLGSSFEVSQEVMLDRVAKDGRYDLHLSSDRTSACLTKVNGRLPRGFSPLVLVDEEATGPLEQRPKVSAQGEGPGAATDHVWRPGVRVRYFSPAEQLRLMGYPADYELPPSLSFKDQCSLLGNSLNVHVVAWLLRFLLPEGLDPKGGGASVDPAAQAAPPALLARGWGVRERAGGPARGCAGAEDGGDS